MSRRSSQTNEAMVRFISMTHDMIERHEKAINGVQKEQADVIQTITLLTLRVVELSNRVLELEGGAELVRGKGATPEGYEAIGGVIVITADQVAAGYAREMPDGGVESHSFQILSSLPDGTFLAKEPS